MSTRRVLLAAALLAACGDAGGSTGPAVPAAVAVVSGHEQAATVAQPAPAPLVVRVADADGDPVQGVSVQWSVVSGGGSLAAASSTTGAEGRAQAQWTLGTRTESQRVSATVQGLAPVFFSIRPGPGPFLRIAVVPDSADLSAVGQTVTLQPSYTDAYGNAVEQPNPVVWTSLDPEVAELTGTRPVGARAVASGRARIVLRTRDLADTRHVADTAIVWVRQQPASLAVTLRDGPSVTEGDTTRALAVVLDAAGHPIPNAPLTWSTTDPSGATVDATGKITALAGDTVDVVAAWGGTMADTATLYVGGRFRAAALSAGGHHSCGLNAAGQARCWGWNPAGQLGVPAAAESGSDAAVAVQTGARFTAIAASAWTEGPAGSTRGHTCAISRAGAALLCWGDNGQGQLGKQGSGATHVPTAVAGGRAWAAVATGGRHTCGITTGGRTYCWGLDGDGQVGAAAADQCSVGGATEPCARVPQAVAGAFTRITAGTAHTCALTAGGQAYCWGRNASGQLGNGTTTGSDVPVAVAGGLTFVSISAGGAHTCAGTAAGNAYCWGDNASGQLVDNTFERATSPVAGNAGNPPQSGGAHGCAIYDGAAACWGANDHGQGGHAPDGSGGSAWSRGVSGGFRFASISTGGRHTCAVRAEDDAVMCWGDNDGGKLGSGTGPDRGLPRPVRMR